MIAIHVWLALSVDGSRVDHIAARVCADAHEVRAALETLYTEGCVAVHPDDETGVWWTRTKEPHRLRARAAVIHTLRAAGSQAVPQDRFDAAVLVDMERDGLISISRGGRVRLAGPAS